MKDATNKVFDLEDAITDTVFVGMRFTVLLWGIYRVTVSVCAHVGLCAISINLHAIRCLPVYAYSLAPFLFLFLFLSFFPLYFLSLPLVLSMTNIWG